MRDLDHGETARRDSRAPIRPIRLRPISFCGTCDRIQRLDYESGLDGRCDWALLRQPLNPIRPWIVCIHGHGSTGDQLFTRSDIRDRWLPAFVTRDLGILTPNLRGNAWMGPDAVRDLNALLDYLSLRMQARSFILASGSMGGSSNLIYAACRPERVQGVIARGAATDLTQYHAWCREHAAQTPVLKDIADAIEKAYGGPPETAPALYRQHSALVNAGRLRMPVFLAHGTADAVIPVSQARQLVAAMRDAPNLAYAEVPGGNHDSPLFMSVCPHPLDWILETLETSSPVPESPKQEPAGHAE